MKKSINVWFVCLSLLVCSNFVWAEHWNNFGIPAPTLDAYPIKFVFISNSDSLSNVKFEIFGSTTFYSNDTGVIEIPNSQSIEAKEITMSKFGYSDLKIQLVHAPGIKKITFFLNSSSINQSNQMNQLVITADFEQQNQNLIIAEQNPNSNEVRNFQRTNRNSPFNINLYDNRSSSRVFFGTGNMPSQLYINGIQDETKIDVVLDDGTTPHNPQPSSNPIKCSWLCRMLGCCK